MVLHLIHDAGIDNQKPEEPGIHLARSCREDLMYDYRNGKNILRIVRSRA
jgi:hypothetical protein